MEFVSTLQKIDGQFFNHYKAFPCVFLRSLNVDSLQFKSIIGCLRSTIYGTIRARTAHSLNLACQRVANAGRKRACRESVKEYELKRSFK